MELIVKEWRGDVPDLHYYGHIVVVDASGEILRVWGDPERVTYSRSSAKPMQAIPVIESKAANEYALTEDELAVICASHNAESFHVEAVLSILKKAGLSENDLLCGTHEALTNYMIGKFREEGKGPSDIHNNCSGKHAGMLITAKILGLSLQDYYQETHPIQEMIRQTIAQICEYDADEIKIGIDGCGIPVHAMPLYKFAQGYARMSKPELLGPHEEAMRKITRAMRKFPKMVGGTNDFTSELMGLFSDKLFCKLGAGGFFAIGLVDQGLGIAMKMEDGGFNSTIPLAAVRLLESIHAISKEEANKAKELNSYKFAKVIKNHRGDTVGSREAVFKVEGIEFAI